MIFKLKTSQKTQQIFAEIGKSTSLKPYTLVKHAIAWSLKEQGKVTGRDGEVRGIAAFGVLNKVGLVQHLHPFEIAAPCGMGKVGHHLPHPLHWAGEILCHPGSCHTNAPFKTTMPAPPGIPGCSPERRGHSDFRYSRIPVKSRSGPPRSSG